MTEFLIEHLLRLLIVFWLTSWNIYAGFLGTFVGEYRMKLKTNEGKSFLHLYKEKESDWLLAWRSGDVSITVGIMFFSALGLVILLVIGFGPVGKEKSTESRIKLK